MPLGFEPGVAQAQLAMSERYGDRLVNSLAQAGQMIEVGLKTVTTMKELNSLGQQMSQLSPESPDYQQQLIGLGARHPFAMQTPQAQQMMQAQNQQHLQWKSQQFAIAQSERSEARADRRDAMTERRQMTRDASQHQNALEIARIRKGVESEGVDFSQGLPQKQGSPVTGFSFGAGMDGAAATEQSQPMPQPAQGFSMGANGGMQLPQAEPQAPQSQGSEIEREYIEQGRMIQKLNGGRPLSQKQAQEMVYKPVNARLAAGEKNKNSDKSYGRKRADKLADDAARAAERAESIGFLELSDGTFRLGNSTLRFTPDETGMMQPIEKKGEPKLSDGEKSQLKHLATKAHDMRKRAEAWATESLNNENPKNFKISQETENRAAAAEKEYTDYLKGLGEVDAKDDEVPSYKDYDSLKSGDIFIDPDGKKRRKP